MEADADDGHLGLCEREARRRLLHDDVRAARRRLGQTRRAGRSRDHRYQVEVARRSFKPGNPGELRATCSSGHTIVPGVGKIDIGF